MALILNIDTATENASVCLMEDDTVLSLAQHDQQKEHASFVHQAIKDILKEADKALKHIDAFAVTSGPGSYTGLRIGLATAKGFCYALSKPLILVNTLKVMAAAALATLEHEKEHALLCPMIDARRMEVFTAVFDFHLNCLVEPHPAVITADFNNKVPQKKYFFGNGSRKAKSMITHQNASFINVTHNASHLGSLAYQCFQQKKFADLSYSEPAYFKEFHTTMKGL